MMTMASFSAQEYTDKGCLGNAMLSILQQLPNVQWMITTLGKRGSVLLQQQQPQQGMQSIVLEDEITAMLSSVSSSSSSSSSRGQSIDDESVGCLSRNNVPIRWFEYALAILVHMP